MRVATHLIPSQHRNFSSRHPFLSFLRTTGLVISSVAVLAFFNAKALAQPDVLSQKQNSGAYGKVLNDDEKQRIERNIYAAVAGTEKSGAGPLDSIALQSTTNLVFRYVNDYRQSTAISVGELEILAKTAFLVRGCEFPEEGACAAMDMMLKVHAGARREQDAWRRRDPDVINSLGGQNDLTIADAFFGLFTTLADKDLLPCKSPEALGTKYKKALSKQRDNSTYWRDLYNRQKFPEPGHITVYLKGNPGKAAANCDMTLGMLQAAEPFIVGIPAIYNHMLAIKEPVLAVRDRAYAGK